MIDDSSLIWLNCNRQRGLRCAADSGSGKGNKSKHSYILWYFSLMRIKVRWLRSQRSWKDVVWQEPELQLHNWIVCSNIFKLPLNVKGVQVSQVSLRGKIWPQVTVTVQLCMKRQTMKSSKVELPFNPAKILWNSKLNYQNAFA